MADWGRDDKGYREDKNFRDDPVWLRCGVVGDPLAGNEPTRVKPRLLTADSVDYY